ncbi:MAG TPA: glycerol-3-phosphate dehydrogenase [Flavobacteriales bacterium]|nr:glycerol-3-phosphate dehydrogenase [Flavobacteriales bacterium]|tara:strand:+ start:2126 stop:3112 length:987 start_codon:yes stop_codon:yes gene_type:complete
MKVGILGSGSWATAIAKMLCINVDTLHWWVRGQDTADELMNYGHNPRYIQSISLPKDKLRVTTDMQSVVDACDMLVVVIPSLYLDSVFRDRNIQGMQDKVLFSAIKGMVSEYDSIPARYLHKAFGTPYENIGIICGPCHAEEVAREKLSYLTVACPTKTHAEWLSGKLETRFIRVQTSDDVFGAELAAVLKNVYAIATGIAHGLGYGDNFVSVLVSNASQEMKRFLAAVHEIDRDVKGSPYLGDLLVTAYSPYSRNRTLGTMIGKGYTVKSAILEMDMVAEGFTGSQGIHALNQKFDVHIPIAEAVYRILHEKMAPSIELRLLSDELA